MTPTKMKNQSVISSDAKLSGKSPLPNLSSVASIVLIILLVYVFFSGLSFQFYASFLFLFYGLTKSMWVSVVMLGVFQTILLIPFRMIRVVKANNIKEFQQTIEKIKNEQEQTFLLKKRFNQGSLTFLFYAVDFVAQLVAYISLGRLFLTDFYATHINTAALYDWVPTPSYPIQDTFFKIPYPAVTETTSFGWRAVLLVWLVLICINILILIARRATRRDKGKEAAELVFANKWVSYATGSLILLMLLAWLLIFHFPVSWELQIFSGDISIPNPPFNAITAIVTFIVLIYHGIPKISRKIALAKKAGVDKNVIDRTQKEMMKDTFSSAAFVGLGAFFITNQIPSAFELSIFTLELISLAAPFTVDRLVLKGMPKNAPVEEKTEPDPEVEEEISSN